MPANKKYIAILENYGRMTGDYAQLEPVVLRDLQQNKGLFKDVKWSDVKPGTKLYDDVVDAYWERMGDFGIPDDDFTRAVWWLTPGRYSRTGGNVEKIESKRVREIMRGRENRLRGHLNESKGVAGAIRGRE